MQTAVITNYNLNFYWLVPDSTRYLIYCTYVLSYNKNRFASHDNHPMTLITLQNINKDFGIKEILRDGSFSIEEDDKVGLIGVNGSGKSTLLKAIAGIESFDSGTVTVKSGTKIVYLPQQPNLNEKRTVLDEVFNDSSEKLKIVRQYEELSQKIESEIPDAEKAKLTDRLTRIMEKMDAMDAWELETKAKIILSKLGITDFEAKVGSLSCEDYS